MQEKITVLAEGGRCGHISGIVLRCRCRPPGALMELGASPSLSASQLWLSQLLYKSGFGTAELAFHAITVRFAFGTRGGEYSVWATRDVASRSTVNGRAVPGGPPRLRPARRHGRRCGDRDGAVPRPVPAICLREAVTQPVVGVFEHLRQAPAYGRAPLRYLDAVVEQQTANSVHLGGASFHD